jgi:subtilisin family serine protease
VRALGALALLFCAAASPATGQELKPVGALRSAGAVTGAASQKIGSPLRALVADFRAAGITRATAGAMDAAGRFSSHLLRVDAAGRVQVYVSVTDTAGAALGLLGAHGLDIEIVNAELRIVQGWLAVERLEPLAGEPVVVTIRPPSYATRRTGSVNSQGDAIHLCNQVRAQGITGAGVKVGVISDGVAGLAASQASGNLPFVQVLANAPGDEGTAMLEIIHDCAPGAALAFATGFPTSLAFVNAVNSLRAAGARIIVDDLGFFGEPFFQDGAIALNDRTVGNAALRVSAAGNDRLTHYQGTFSPGVFDAEIPGTRHNFGGGDTLLRIRVPGGATVSIVLQWGNAFGGSVDDYDLCVRQSGVLVACSLGAQTATDDPIEVLSIACTTPPGTFCAGDLQITRFSGAARPLELFCLGCGLDEFNVHGDSIVGHPAAPEVLAVAASPAGNPAAIESFSSAGPSTILFPAPQVRAKPDVTGTDGVATSRPGFSPFFGTSAAAPHVAAVAALLLQRQPALSVARLREVLKGSAVDLAPAGFDFGAGFGRASAPSGVAAMPATSVGFQADFDGDGRADVGVYRTSTGEWLIRRSTDGVLFTVTWGSPALGDVPVPARYTTTGVAEIAVFRPTTGEWLIRRASDSALVTIAWGAPILGDVPVPADYTGDGLADVAVYRTATGEWLIRRSDTAALLVIPWGAPSLGDSPVPADYTGDGLADVAVYRSTTGQWFLRRSDTAALLVIPWGAPSLGDFPVPAHYVTPGVADIAVYRMATGQWFIRRSDTAALLLVAWGAPALGDTPVPASYVGDARADIAVYRTSTGAWLIRNSDDATLVAVGWGAPALADVPLTRRP